MQWHRLFFVVFGCFCIYVCKLIYCLGPNSLSTAATVRKMTTAQRASRLIIRQNDRVGPSSLGRTVAVSGVHHIAVDLYFFGKKIWGVMRNFRRGRKVFGPENLNSGQSVEVDKK